MSETAGNGTPPAGRGGGAVAPEEDKLMPEQSIAMQLFLEPFKSAAAEGAVLELKLRLLAGSVPALEKYALEWKLENVEDPVIAHFGNVLSTEEQETLRLCRKLRNKVLHADFHAARENLCTQGVEISSGQVKKIELPTSITVATISEKIRGAKAGTEGTNVSDTSTASGTVYGWFLEAGSAGDFEKASEVFKKASEIIDRLARFGGYW